MRISDSEVHDEDNFFFGGGGGGVGMHHDVVDVDDVVGGFGADGTDQTSLTYENDKLLLPDDVVAGDLLQIEGEPLVGSTLNLFKLSGKNIPTETDKYESSVYQTPELNPQLNESMKLNNNVPNNGGGVCQSSSNDQVIDAIKKLEYDSNSQQQRQLQPELLMSTMTKARPGVAVSGFLSAATTQDDKKEEEQDSGSEENVPDSNDEEESSFEAAKNNG